MVQSLADYVKKEVAEGYSVEQIKSALIKYGYSQLQIDDAINQYYGQAGKKGKIQNIQRIRPQFRISKRMILIILSVFVLALAVFAVLNFSGIAGIIGKQESKKVSISFEAVSSDVNPGQDIIFTKIISSDSFVSVSFSYQIIDKEKNVVLADYEKLDAEGDITSQKSITIPESTELGEYQLKIISRYEGKEQIDYLPVKVYMASDYATCYDNILNQGEEDIDCGGPCRECAICPESCDDSDECTSDYCSESSGYECSHEIIDSCRQASSGPEEEKEEIKEDSGNSVPESKKTTLRSVRDNLYPLIKSNPAEAARVCGTITESVERDVCLKTVAELSNSSSYCSYITLQLTKDSCYMKFVINSNEFQHCDKIQDSYLKDSCESIKKMKEMEAQYYEQQNQ